MDKNNNSQRHVRNVFTIVLTLQLDQMNMHTVYEKTSTQECTICHILCCFVLYYNQCTEVREDLSVKSV